MRVQGCEYAGGCGGEGQGSTSAGVLQGLATLFCEAGPLSLASQRLGSWGWPASLGVCLPLPPQGWGLYTQAHAQLCVGVLRRMRTGSSSPSSSKLFSECALFRPHFTKFKFKRNQPINQALLVDFNATRRGYHREVPRKRVSQRKPGAGGRKLQRLKDT